MVSTQKTVVYRFTCDGEGLYAAVDKHCPRDDVRRENKPDGSWLIKAGTDYPGAISYWTEAGLKKYTESELRDWHISVVRGHVQIWMAPMPEEVLYSDDLQVIAMPEEFVPTKWHTLEYAYSEYKPRKKQNRHACIVHFDEIDDRVMGSYPHSRETLLSTAYFGKHFDFTGFGLGVDVILPGKRSSWPHAHSHDDEFVYVLEGTPSVWLDGELHELVPGDAVGFKAGEGTAHTFINNSSEVAKILVVGSKGQKDDKVFYPMHPARNEECKRGGYFWEGHPQHELGPHSGEPN